MAPDKMQLDKFRKIDKFRKELRQEIRTSCLDDIGTREERDNFIDILKEYFYEKSDDAFHYFIYEKYNKPFLFSCKQLGIKVSRFTCECKTENERAHRHYIVWIPNPKKVKTPTMIISRKLRQVMAELKISKEDKKCIYGKKIKSRAHLLNTVLYIMTADTRGTHGGAVVDCKHFGHKFLPVIPDRKALLIFRKEEVDYEIPGYEEERKKEWQQFKTAKDFDDYETYEDMDADDIFNVVKF